MDALHEIKKQLITAAHRAYSQGVQTNSGGNFSARVPGKDLMVVKPRGRSFIDCDEDSLVVMDFEGNVIEGKLQPTKECLLHSSIYKSVPTADAIMHCHAVWAIAYANSGKDLEMSTLQSDIKFSAPVRNIAIPTPAVSETDMPKIIRLFEENPTTSAFILQRHGTVAVAKNIIVAEQLVEMVEETAKVAIISKVYLSANDPV